MSSVNWLDVLGWSIDELEDLRYVGYSYIKQGKYDLALKFFEALVVLDESSSYDLQTLGAIYLQIGKNLEALDYLERALKLDDSHAPTLINKAKALFLLGYKKQGLGQAKRLAEHEDPKISNQAKALILSYS